MLLKFVGKIEVKSDKNFHYPEAFYSYLVEFLLTDKYYFYMPYGNNYTFNVYEKASEEDKQDYKLC